jgi:hypothetical protein
VSLFDRLFPPREGVGGVGRVFLAAVSPKPSRAPLFGPPSSWTQRKPKPTPPDAYAARIIRRHEQWPHQEWPGGGPAGYRERPYAPWPGGGDRR